MPSLPLSNLQLQLMKVYSQGVTEKQLKDIQQLLAGYFLDQSTEAMDALWEENQWGDEKLQEWHDMHERTPYPPHL